MPRLLPLVVLLLLAAAVGRGHDGKRPLQLAIGGPPGARSFKSGPIQITADGRFVWNANTDNHSVARIDTLTEAVAEFPLPDAPSLPRGLAVLENGSEVWVAGHDSDRVYVLRGSDGAPLARIDLPWGSGPASIAIAPDQRRALVALHRSAALAVLDVSARALVAVLPVFRSPIGIAFTDDGSSAWVTHLLADGEHGRLTRVDFSAATARARDEITAFASDPRVGSRLPPPNDLAEGGYLNFRGHLAQVPRASGRYEMWLPTQYQNRGQDRFTPDSSVQATIRHLDLATGRLLNTTTDKVVLTAVQVHDPVASGNPYVGPGWNAQVAGAIDLAFTRDGAMAYVACELSNDVVALPTAAPPVRPAGAPPLAEVAVGLRPTGLVVSPTTGVVYVSCLHSRAVSVVDPVRAREARRLATTPLTGEPFAPAFLRGAQLFHTSDDPRISSNRKVACASCHMNAELEGRSWAFETLPGLHGPRLTPSLRTLARTLGPRDPASGFGQLHRSGDRDELQDFEHTFRGPIMGGTGFLGVGAQPELGAPNAGRDGDLDAIATYLAGLAPVARSPARAPGGALGEAAVRGATFFRGADPSGHAADANCASCHVPETGFVDFRFHDVGAARPAAERELNAPARGVWQWKVNTKTLVNAWLNAPYDGVAAGEPESLLEVLKDLRGRPTHGHVDQLTGRQLRDLDELLRSIDGDLAAADVRGARDTVPPRVVRVEPASLTVVDVWFSESVERASAEALSSWRIVDLTARQDAPVTAATWDSRNGDRVTLRTQLQRSHAYEVVPGPILDLAATASGGVANRLVASAEETTPVRSFTVGDTLTVTLGGSGYENVTVRVHDSGVAGPGLPTWNHDSPVLFFSGSTAGRGFVRFDWAAPFAAVTGVVDPAALVDASVTLHPENGVSHAVEARRCLLSWSDPPTGGNWNQNAVGAPTWRDHAHPSGPWNQAGAQRRTAGVNGASVTDYNGANDVAFVPDAVAAMTGIHEPLVIAGPQVTEAFRFWLANPQVDYGFALSFTAGAPQATRFERSEAGLGEEGPVLRITYRP